MPYSITINELALKNAAKAIEWYENKQLGLGLSFEESLNECYDAILQNPFAFSFVSNFIRRAKLERFPYIVLFEIYGEAVFISNVFNTNQDPGKMI